MSYRGGREGRGVGGEAKSEFTSLSIHVGMRRKKECGLILSGFPVVKRENKKLEKTEERKGKQTNLL